MNRKLVILKLIEELQNQRNSTVQSSLDASGNATHEEAKAESKWDTQALESSYIAAGHAMRAKDISNDIQSLQAILLDMDVMSSNKIVTGSLLYCIFEKDNAANYFYLSSHGGGIEFKIEEHSITILNPSTPLGRILLDSKVGDTVKLLDGSSLKIEKLLL